jgi:hypothetical protein
MKYPKEQFELLVSGLRVLASHWKGLTKEIALQRHMLHSLHFRVYLNYTYPISNANITFNENGERILPLTESFELHPNNTHDDQIETAMKKAIEIVF